MFVGCSYLMPNSDSMQEPIGGRGYRKRRQPIRYTVFSDTFLLRLSVLFILLLGSHKKRGYAIYLGVCEGLFLHFNVRQIG
jgi:hypothetical protein